jgi:caffeoyl-CoA O-methyltransferase
VDGHIYTINRDEKHIQLAQNFFAKSDCADKITMLAGDAKLVLPTIKLKNIDMIFIDADKIHYNDYLDWAEENLRVGGLLIADNSLLGGKVAAEKPENIAPTTWQNIRRFNARLADKSKYNATIIPTREGLSVGIRL